MGSADWMPRNLDRRVEILFPVLRPELKERVRHIMELELADNMKAHVLMPDGTYEKPDRRGKAPVNSQMIFCEEAIAAAEEERRRAGQRAGCLCRWRVMNRKERITAPSLQGACFFIGNTPIHLEKIVKKT